MEKIHRLPKGLPLASDHDLLTHQRNVELWRAQDQFEEEIRVPVDIVEDEEELVEEEELTPEEEATLNLMSMLVTSTTLVDLELDFSRQYPRPKPGKMFIPHFRHLDSDEMVELLADPTPDEIQSEIVREHERQRALRSLDAVIYGSSYVYEDTDDGF